MTGGASEGRRTELLRDLDRDTGWVLLVDGVEQSYVDVEDPTHLEFEYMQHIALAVDATLPAPGPVRAVHLGGGAQTIPRWLHATRAGTTQVVIESDPAVLDTVAWLGPVPGCEVIVGDALRALEVLPASTFDLLVWDLYDGPRAVTATLTGEAIAGMRRLLRDDNGVLVLNVSDVKPFDVVRPVLAAMREHCADVVVLAEPSTLRGRRSGNCVLVGATAAALPVEELRRLGAGAPVRARVVAADELAGFVGAARPASVDEPLPLPDEALGRGFL
jgi:spermidine synthase